MAKVGSSVDGQFRVQGLLVNGLALLWLVVSFAAALCFLQDEVETQKLRKASLATLRSIDKNPRPVSNWNRLAYIDVVDNGKLTSEGLAALEESFMRSPYGSVEDMYWRLEFTNAFWPSLTIEVKTQSLAQVTALSTMGLREQRWLRKFYALAAPDIQRRISVTPDWQ